MKDEDPKFGVRPLAVYAPNTREHRLELRGEAMQIEAKEDGCLHLRKFYNGVHPDEDASVVTENSDYIHICDLDEFIKHLQQIKELTIKHFGK